MFSSAVSSSSRLWSWKTIPIALRTPSWSLVTSIPMTVAVPEVGSSMVESIESVVVLPAPFGPRRPKISPCSISKLIRSTATRSPKRRVRSAAWIAVVMSDHIFFSLSRQCSRIAPTLRSFPGGMSSTSIFISKRRPLTGQVPVRRSRGQGAGGGPSSCVTPRSSL